MRRGALFSLLLKLYNSTQNTRSLDRQVCPSDQPAPFPHGKITLHSSNAPPAIKGSQGFFETSKSSRYISSLLDDASSPRKCRCINVSPNISHGSLPLRVLVYTAASAPSSPLTAKCKKAPCHASEKHNEYPNAGGASPTRGNGTPFRGYPWSVVYQPRRAADEYPLPPPPAPFPA